MSDALQNLAQQCYDLAKSGNRPTRAVAARLVATADHELVAAMAVEYLVDVVAREQRAATLDAERSASASRTAQMHEASTAPRKGTKARYDWEQNTEEGRAWAAAEDEMWLRHTQLLSGTLQKALDRYAEDLHIRWTADLLDSTFALRDGLTVTWGAATEAQHEERRAMFLDNAHANMEGAARHELALRDLRAAGVSTLGDLAMAQA